MSNTSVCVCFCVHDYIIVYIYIYTDIYLFVYIYIYIYLYICRPWIILHSMSQPDAPGSSDHSSKEIAGSPNRPKQWAPAAWSMAPTIMVRFGDVRPVRASGYQRTFRHLDSLE